LQSTLEAAEVRQAIEPEVLSTVRDAAEGAQRIAQILTDLRGFTRQPKTTAAAECEPWPSLEWALRVTAKERNEKAQLDLAISPMPKVALDATRLGQVFVNLLTNAAQAISPGALKDHHIGVKTATDEQGAAVIEVSDSGAGITPEQRRRLFSAFFTTKGPKQGTGLGLFIAHGIVESAGGRIEVESLAKGGTMFRVVLPAAQGHSRG
jgi:C4-dicarboxylate-specific signal transduction histidine kinase